ncbi:MAG: Cobalt-zinc-cadmium resistance protein CzcB [Chlamydiae bacterium]|nr:Cobalt-zinc-cadmium resistance protein CzcB [Chlamydiota bacterium]
MTAWNKGILIGLWVVLMGGIIYKMIPEKSSSQPWLATAEKRSFDVDVRSVGVLEAENSLVVFSSIRGDQGKIIELISDGKHVEKDELLVRLDPTPFELKLFEIEAKIREQEAIISALENAVDMEREKAVLEERTAKYEMKNAQIEHVKIVDGDGPMEIAKLKSALDKAQNQYDEFKSYEADLDQLEQKGFLSAGEKRQALKKLEDARETYEAAKMQHDSYVEYVYPLQVKKAEVGLKKARLKLYDTAKSAAYRVVKAEETLEQHLLGLDYLVSQRQEALRELALTEIKAPTPGMAVLREEYRSGERRRPRVGDVVLKNQPLLNLPDMSSSIVKTKVREVDLHKIAVGKIASIEIDAYPDLKLDGEVVAIGVLAVSGRHQDDEKVFEVTIRLTESDSKLRPGMTARVTIHSESVNEKLTVPLHAIFTRNNTTYCYKKSFGSFKSVPISMGPHNENWSEVLEGLDEGDQIALIDPEQMP